MKNILIILLLITGCSKQSDKKDIVKSEIAGVVIKTYNNTRQYMDGTSKIEQQKIVSNFSQKSREYMKIPAVADVIFHGGAIYKNVQVISTNVNARQNGAFVTCEGILKVTGQREKFTHNMVLENGQWKIELL
jgi:PBP1b-binding outer membrane lipoprotein LpoB